MKRQSSFCPKKTIEYPFTTLSIINNYNNILCSDKFYKDISRLEELKPFRPIVELYRLLSPDYKDTLVYLYNKAIKNKQCVVARVLIPKTEENRMFIKILDRIDDHINNELFSK